MSKVPREVLTELWIVANKLPQYEETAYTKQNAIGNDVNLKGFRTDLSHIDRKATYTATKNTGRYIDSDRHFKRLRNAYKISGDVGVFAYIRKHSKTNRTFFSFWGFIKFHIFGIKPKGYLLRK